MTAPIERPQRIGLVVNAWPEPGGEPSGTGRNAQYVAEELARRGHDVVVLVTTSSGETWRSERTEERPRICVAIVDLYRPTYRSAYRHVPAERELTAWLEQREPDVVHVIHPGETGLRAPAVIAAAGIPVVMTACDAYYGCHMGHLVNPRERRSLCELPIAEPECARCMAVGTGLSPEWMLPLAHERRLLASASTAAGPMVADSDFIGRQIRRAFPNAMVSTLSLPVPTAEPDTSTRTGPLTLGFFGVPSWRKGLDLILDAIDGLPNVRLKIHGPTTYTFEPGYGEALAARVGGMPNAEWIGPYSPEDASTVMRSVDVVVVPSRAESLPGVVKEAMAAGRPVLGADVSGIPELVRDGSGWLVEPGSAGSLRNQIQRLLADLDATRATKPSLDLPIRGYVDALLDRYAEAGLSLDVSASTRALSDAAANSARDGFIRRDDLFQTALLERSTGRRRAILQLVLSLHRGAADRFWTTLTWLLWWPGSFDRTFRRVLAVQRAPLDSVGRRRSLRLWLRAARS